MSKLSVREALAIKKQWETGNFLQPEPLPPVKKEKKVKPELKVIKVKPMPYSPPDRKPLVRKSIADRFRYSEPKKHATVLLPEPEVVTEQTKVYEVNRVGEVRHIERNESDRLSKELHGEREVQAGVGRIDILTDEEIIEVKLSDKWDDAIGQLFRYSLYYPDRRLRLHLIGLPNIEAVKVCEKFGITLTHTV